MVYEGSSGDLGLLSYAKPDHLIVVPETKHGLNSAIGEAHRRYTRRINFREGWRGHLLQEKMELLLDRKLKPQKSGPKKKDK